MASSFLRPALVCNRESGNHDPAIQNAIADHCIRHGAPLVATFTLPDQALPNAAALRRVDADLLIVWTGDGTINAAATQAGNWAGAILPLPGGTLNLLSKHLHGDRAAEDILIDVLSDQARQRPLPIIRSAGGQALITVVAGPATRWADVRETMRQDGVIEASRDAPEALETMLNAPGVRVAGKSATYPAVILTPTDKGLVADGIQAEGAGDILRHGLAWLGGDFRDGPSEEIARGETIILESDAPISLEYDGELSQTASPARFALGMSRINFVATA